MPRLVTSYSHVDESLRCEFEKHLSLLKRSGRIESWHDRQILPVDEVDATIDAHFARADIVILLVSPDFLSSRYCMDIEVWRALHRHERGEARVVPVILRPCDWQDAPFGRLQACPRDGRPISLWTNRDEAFLDAVQAIKRLLPQRNHDPLRPHPQADARRGSDSRFTSARKVPSTDRAGIRDGKPQKRGCSVGYSPRITHFYAKGLGRVLRLVRSLTSKQGRVHPRQEGMAGSECTEETASLGRLT